MTDQRATEASLMQLNLSQVHETIMQHSKITTISAMSGLHLPRPQANFPLPRELRDHIYSYLLDGTHAKTKREQVGDRAYKFHTNILRVNREIHDEAQEYLFKNNVFLVVTHQLTNAVPRSISPWVPIVVELCQTNITNQSLEISYSEVPYTQSSCSGIAKRSWLLHADDLNSYCRTMARKFNANLVNAPSLWPRSDGTLFDACIDDAGQQRSSNYLRLESRSRRLREMTCKLQSYLLSPFRTLFDPSAFVSICGNVAGRIEAEELEVSMGSNLLCYRALGWQTFQALNELKVVADVCLHAYEYVVASNVHSYLSFVLNASFDSPALQSMPDIAPAMAVLMLANHLTNAYLQLKMRRTDSFTKSVIEVYGFFEPTLRDSSAILPSALLHLRISAISASGNTFELSPHLNVAECTTALTSDDTDAHRMHDIAILKKCADHSKVIGPEDLPIASCSIYALPYAGVDIQGVKVPDHIAGFSDFQALRETDKDMRKKINCLQVEIGWHAMKFELCDSP